MEKTITEKEFRKLLDEYDWYYNMTDDYSLWSRGDLQRIKIERICKENPLFNKIYQEELSKKFKSTK